MAEKLTKNERREMAREQARLAREEEKKREKRRRLYLQGGIVLGVIAILAVVGIVLMQTLKPAGPGPANMASGGVVFGEDLSIIENAGLDSGEERVAPEVDRSAGPLDIAIYVDYSCDHCANFEQAYGSLLENWVGSGDATLQVYPVNILGPQATSHSTRAANLVMCVVDQNPGNGAAFNVHNELLSASVYDMAMQSGGLSQDQLVDLARNAGADITNDLQLCIRDVRHASFVSGNTRAATTDKGVFNVAEGSPLVESEANGQLVFQDEDGPQVLRGTPLVLVNGLEWRSNRDGELGNFLAKVKAEVEGNGAPSSQDDEEAEDQ